MTGRQSPPWLPQPKAQEQRPDRAVHHQERTAPADDLARRPQSRPFDNECGARDAKNAPYQAKKICSTSSRTARAVRLRVPDIDVCPRVSRRFRVADVPRVADSVSPPTGRLRVGEDALDRVGCVLAVAEPCPAGGEAL